MSSDKSYLYLGYVMTLGIVFITTPSVYSKGTIQLINIDY